MKITATKSQGVSISVVPEDKAIVVTFVDRELTFHAIDHLKESLRETIKRQLAEGYQHFVLNLENIRKMDSSGVSLLIVAHRLLQAPQGRLYLCNVTPEITKLLDKLQVSKHVPNFETEEHALAEARRNEATAIRRAGDR